jgi:hypothetical protein
VLNWRILGAWPNWITIPAILLFWIFLAVELQMLLGGRPLKSE